MPLSAVAGILSPDGGLRTVATEVVRGGRKDFAPHLKKGERLFIVPDLLVEEPIDWGQIPDVIRRVHRHVVTQTAPANPCGSCRECCVTPNIDSPEFKKPSHQTCHHCDVDIGCMVNFNKPKACRLFECEWLSSQRTNHRMGEELRPDVSGAIITGAEDGDPEDLFYVHPSLYRAMSEAMKVWIAEEQADGSRKARLVTHYHGEVKP